MALDNGDHVVVHIDDDGHAHLHRIVNPVEALHVQITILSNRAFEVLSQGRFVEVCIFSMLMLII